MIKFVVVFSVCLVGLIRLAVIFADKIKFYTTGADSGFSLNEISLLWKLAKFVDLEDPMALYWSVPALNKSITAYISDCQKKDILSTPKAQNFLEKLYSFRTKIDIESSKKKGIESTKYLDKGQKIRIILPGHGVFTSEILNNGMELVVRTPKQKGVVKIPPEQWVGKNISVYLWRKGDANYAFDTTVTNHGMFNANSSIYLSHTSNLSRMQKRKSVRAQCNLYANMYFILDENDINYDKIEKERGYKCLLEDISEDGALIRIGGKGHKDAKIKLQFEIGQDLIIMHGMVRAVEYNEQMNQSRLHFECIKINKEMKNQVLSFVYNCLPQDQKDILDALKMNEEDAAEEEKTGEETESKAKSDEDEIENFDPESLFPEEDEAPKAESGVMTGAEEVYEEMKKEKSGGQEKIAPNIDYNSKNSMSHLSLLKG